MLIFDAAFGACQKVPVRLFEGFQRTWESQMPYEGASSIRTDESEEWLQLRLWMSKQKYVWATLQPRQLAQVLA